MGRGKHLTVDEKINIIKLTTEEKFKPDEIAAKLGKSVKSIKLLLTKSLIDTESQANKNITIETGNITTNKNNYVKNFCLVSKPETRGRKRSLSPDTIKERITHIHSVV